MYHFKRYYFVILSIFFNLTTISQDSLCQNYDSNWRSQECPILVDSIYEYDVNAQLDTILHGKKLYQYNAFEQLISRSELYNWLDDLKRWEVYYKSERKYDEKGKLSELLSYNYDYERGWIILSKSKFEYDSLGNKVLEEVYDYNYSVAKWICVGQKSWKFEYDDSGNILVHQFLIWNETLSEWENKWEVEYSYDSQDRVLSLERRKWNSMEWEDVYKWLYTYDSLPGIISYVEYWWDQSWEVEYKAEFDNSLEKYTFLKTYTWDKTSRTWLESEYETREFDAGGDLSLDIFYWWDSEQLDWVPSYKREYRYDFYDELISEAYYTYDEISSNWVFVNTDYYVHFQSELSFSVDIHGEQNPLLGSTERYIVKDNGLNKCLWSVENGKIVSIPDNYSVDITWTEGTEGVISVVAENLNGCLSDSVSMQINVSQTIVFSNYNEHISIYPNPVNDLLIIHTKNLRDCYLEIRNVRGVVLHSANMASYNEIDLTFLRPGAYIISIFSNDLVSTSKFIKH